MPTCRSEACGAEIIFVPSATSGRPMVLDAEPAKGVVMVVGDPNTELGHALFEADVPEMFRAARVVDVYTDHHVTCPDAEAWKGRRR